MSKEEFQAVSIEDAERDFDSVAAKAENGPVQIMRDGKTDLLVFSWADYMARFGSLYTPEEIKAIEEACRNYKEEADPDGGE